MVQAESAKFPNLNDDGTKIVYSRYNEGIYFVESKDQIWHSPILISRQQENTRYSYSAINSDGTKIVFISEKETNTVWEKSVHIVEYKSEIWAQPVKISESGLKQTLVPVKPFSFEG